MKENKEKREVFEKNKRHLFGVWAKFVFVVGITCFKD